MREGFQKFLLAVVSAAVLAGGAIQAQVPARANQPLSARNANYTIQVRLDAKKKLLTGTEVLEWRNRTAQPARELWFHLYWNAWRNNQSTWIREVGLRPGRFRSNIREGDWSYSNVKSVRVLPFGPFPETDLTAAMRFASPDDGNPGDRTVLVVPLLQRWVLPGETIRVEIEFEAKIPRTFARTGFRGDYFFLAQWFPKLGVFEPGGVWNNHQFHASTEFFSDYGVYDVSMTVPSGWVVGATGQEIGKTDNGDGTATHQYRQADVHDFAWTTSPDFLEETRLFNQPGLKPVMMRFLYQPEHAGQVDRHFKATETALKYYGAWYGEYPYDQITFIDPAWGSGSGGMEYPTFFTCGTRILNPFGGGRPEGVTVHEAGHQFWYGIVGNNEFEYAWIDEGLNTFSTSRAMSVEFGDTAYVRRFFRGFWPVMAPGITRSRMVASGLDRYRSAARRDIEATPSFLYHPRTSSSITYSKTALWLLTLENILGWDTLRQGMSAFFQRWKFRHPKPGDFFAAISQAAGQNLDSFFNQVFYQPAVFDFAVESVSSRPVRAEGLTYQNGQMVYSPGETGDDEESADTLYETRVVIRRMQDGILPVEVLFRFEDGEEVRDTWDAQALWKEYQFVKLSKLAFAAVDPEHKIALDVNYTNNSRRLVPQANFPATKWASKWMIWLQDYLQTLAFLF